METTIIIKVKLATTEKITDEELSNIGIDTTILIPKLVSYDIVEVHKESEVE